MRLLIITSLLIAPALSAQTVAARPVVAIGGPMANTNDELVRVSAARRLPDGRIVVATGDPLELRVYDRAGKLLNRIGRKGGGPGEFSARVSVPYADNDSIVTFTDNDNRFEVFRPGGKLLHEYTNKPAPWPPPLLHRALLRSPDGAVNGCARAVMMSLPLLTPINLQEVIPDRSGHLWAHALGTRDWRIYSLAGPFLGTVTLPPEAIVLDLGADYILAHMPDADDIEQVVEFRVNVPAGALAPPCASRRDAFASAPLDVARVNEFKRVLHDAMPANERVYSDVAHYPQTADSLHLKLPAGTRFAVIEGSGRGYADVVLDTRTTLFCVIRVGNGSYNWPDAVPFCGN